MPVFADCWGGCNGLMSLFSIPGMLWSISLSAFVQWVNRLVINPLPHERQHLASSRPVLLLFLCLRQVKNKTGSLQAPHDSESRSDCKMILNASQVQLWCRATNLLSVPSSETLNSDNFFLSCSVFLSLFYVWKCFYTRMSCLSEQSVRSWAFDSRVACGFAPALTGSIIYLHSALLTGLSSGQLSHWHF